MCDEFFKLLKQMFEEDLEYSKYGPIISCKMCRYTLFRGSYKNKNNFQLVSIDHGGIYWYTSLSIYSEDDVKRTIKYIKLHIIECNNDLELNRRNVKRFQ